MESIKQKADPPWASLDHPDFRNVGVMLRVLVLANLLALGTVLIQAQTLGELPDAMLEMAARLELPLFVALLLLYLMQPLLARMLRRLWWASVLTIVVVLAWVAYEAFNVAGQGAAWRWMLWGVALTVLIVAYLEARTLRYSPALTEARLMALTARIRPHFLFNSLNAVLGVLRADPRRAERALEELAELFRVLMRENRELVSLDDEIRLCERYLDIESLRLGERLRVTWALTGCPRDALVPPLLLQPLLENAVYHGIEPSDQPGEIIVRGRRKGQEVWLEVDNPLHDDDHARRSGNRMALDNIRERLMLFFDLEARLEKSVRQGRYRVSICLPYRRPAR